MTIKDIQRQLKAEGYNVGGIDGDWGPLTQSAMDASQRHKGIWIPPWLILAERELGVHEIAGRASNKRIEHYFAFTSLGPSTDDVPWCSAFANYCMSAADIKGTNSAAAASWLRWGKKTASFVYGCVCVFSRTGGHHVAFGVASDQSTIAVLGGNQSDSVCVTLRSRANLIGMRTP